MATASIVLEDRIGRLAARFADGPDRASLAAAIHALVEEEGRSCLRRGMLEIDLLGRTVRVGGRPVELMPREYGVLLALARAEHAVSGASLRRAVLGRDFDTGTNAIAVHVSRLRGKLGKDAVLTVPGEGYRLGVFAIADESRDRVE